MAKKHIAQKCFAAVLSKFWNNIFKKLITRNCGNSHPRAALYRKHFLRFNSSLTCFAEFVAQYYCDKLAARKIDLHRNEEPELKVE